MNLSNGKLWLMIILAVVPLGLAAAATIATGMTTSERVAVSAWVSVAVVGTASVIASATIARHQ
ncbi:hypothetical protein Plim_3258 [Planctopirus limnophila DSM 3776]|uniref:Uncharacterized protein n=1 Tax=Planctopirus limnophila (strain ATCC 43296 / DSM 3776 / IFAM 1008 / Mu 290) TaxID=521674 RepID=D5STP2_PLAL2|nr:hypothetical protein [Planctopirus limnophila]ADG69071.1 hypothetical protein Plim_3258 [Planctopirus limnophila DSM 3776]